MCAFHVIMTPVRYCAMAPAKTLLGTAVNSTLIDTSTDNGVDDSKHVCVCVLSAEFFLNTRCRLIYVGM